MADSPRPFPVREVRAVVEWWSNEEGWAALSAEEIPGGAFAHFSAIETAPNTYRSLQAGQEVEAEIAGPLPFEQDGYRYRATWVRVLKS